MKVWAHTLFKNEERWLWYAVSSAINHVDKLLLWDTGSTDGSFAIARSLSEKYPDKISLKQYGPVTARTFLQARQAMLDETSSDWFLVCDADEIWSDESLAAVVKEINFRGRLIESIVVPTVNLIGDVFHYQPESA